MNKKANKICLGLMSKQMDFSIGANACYSLSIILKCIVFCAMRKLYFESGLEEFSNRVKERLPNADTINRRIKKKTKEKVIAEFMKTQDAILSKLRKMRLLTHRATALIDITEIPYRGDNCDEINNYTFGSGVTTKLFFTLNKKKKASAKIGERYFSWCTNMDVKPQNRDILADIYGRRWNIENFYRDGKGNFLAKTKSKVMEGVFD